MIRVKAYHNKEQNRRLRQLFSGKWAIQVRNPGMSRGWIPRAACAGSCGREAALECGALTPLFPLRREDRGENLRLEFSPNIGFVKARKASGLRVVWLP